jgi:hypothetical protein
MALIQQRGKQVVLALLCSILFAYLCIHLFTPGSESSFKQGPLAIHSKTPSNLQKFLGNRTHSFEAKNNDEKDPQKILVSGTTTEAQPDFKILQGEEYVKKLWQSEDGRRQLYLLDIPPLETVTTAVTSQNASINVFPLGGLPPDLPKILKEHYHYDVGKPKKNQ